MKIAMNSRYPGGVWAIDFEFHTRKGVEGNPPDPVCMVAKDYVSGQTIRVWRDELVKLKQAPFPTDNTSLLVAYYASAEIGCFLSLGWALPKNVLDLFAEFRCLSNGSTPPHGSGLIGALLHFGIRSIDAEEKNYMRDLILSRGPWSREECKQILDYCESDVTALIKLLPVMMELIDHPRALLRGEYMVAVAHIESIGVPMDTNLLALLNMHWEGIQDQLIAQIDTEFGVYEGRSFKYERWEQYLSNAGIPWPRIFSGALDMSDDAFRQMSRAYPQIAPVRELRYALSKMRLATLTVGTDGRNRCMLSAFRSTTGRNQPSNSKFIFGPSVWMRGLIKPKPGFGLAYIDWSQQEFGVAAALSDDPKMMEAYMSGDPYLAFAKQAGAVPPNATKKTHKAEREQFKAAVLAVQYGMGPDSLAIRINQPISRARQLLALHRSTYRTFWTWSDEYLNQAVLGSRMQTNFGWELHVPSNPNERSLRNFPMQSHGAEMLRIACVLLTRAGIRICAPVHDAILIEAPLKQLDGAIDITQQLMRQASHAVNASGQPHCAERL
jgi:hypothetical protein